MKAVVNVVISAVSLTLLWSCAHRDQTARTARTDYVRTAVAEGQQSFQHFFGKELKPEQARAMTPQELGRWLHRQPGRGDKLPCEIKSVLDLIDKGNIDPSPIAIDVSAASPTPGAGLIFVPRHPAANTCSRNRGGMFVDDGGCSEKTLECAGVIGSSVPGQSCPHTCKCKLVCGGSPTDCSTC